MNKLTEIQVNEISMVDAGANPEAHILLVKRKQEETSMAKDVKSVEAVNKQEEMTEPVTKNEAVDVEKEELQKRIAELEKALAERDAAEQAALEKAAKDKAAAETEALQETLKRAIARNEELVEKMEMNELLKVASKYEVLGETADDLSKTFKVAKSAGNYDELIALLDKSLAAVEKAGTFTEVGKSGYGTMASAQTQIEKIAAEIKKAEPNLTDRQALDKAFVQHPELQY